MVTITPDGEAGTWSLLGRTYHAAATDSADTIAMQLATAINGSTYLAVPSGATISITKIDAAATDFTASVTFTPTAAVTGSSVGAAVVTVPGTFVSTDTFTLHVDANQHDFTGFTDPDLLATALTTYVNGLGGYTAVESTGGIVTIAATASATISVELDLNTTDTGDVASASAVAYTFSGSPVAGETWAADGESYPVQSGDALADVISALQDIVHRRRRRRGRLRLDPHCRRLGGCDRPRDPGGQRRAPVRSR